MTLIRIRASTDREILVFEREVAPGLFFADTFEMVILLRADLLPDWSRTILGWFVISYSMI